MGKVHYDLLGIGDIDIGKLLHPDEIKEMSAEQIEEYIRETVWYEVFEQGDYVISLNGVRDLLTELGKM
jgi:hypothetical protein